MSNYDKSQVNDWRALLYAFALRNQKDPRLTLDEVFFYVYERYPHTEKRLREFLSEREFFTRSAAAGR